MRMIGLRIDRDECISCGTCWGVCPEVFEENPADGLSQIVEKYRTGTDLGSGEASEELEGCTKDAEESCPVQIIHAEVRNRVPEPAGGPR